VLELVPPLDEQGRPEHAAERFAWGVLLLGGLEGGLSCPDNAAFDPSGGLWIATDGEPAVTRSTDGLWAVTLDGDERGAMRRFLRGPVGCEICGPCFSPDGKTLFVTVQHPGAADEAGKARDFHFDAPACRWPDEREDLPPRAAVLAIERDDGEPIRA
jgi:secreted PhoX family phosphatase